MTATTPSPVDHIVWHGPPELAALLVPIDQLEPLPGNPRRGDVDAVTRSLQRFGQLKPVTYRPSDRTVTAGNHTRQAALALGWTHLAAVPVEQDDATAKAWALADNRTSDLATNDDEDLAAMLQAVAAADADLLAAASYTSEDLVALLADLHVDFDPSTADDQPHLDELAPPTEVECPHCGGRFLAP